MKKLILLLLPLCLLSCGPRTPKKPPIDLSAAKTRNVVEVKYDNYAGVKTIPVKINGIVLDMIYDTGCSGISLSLTELRYLAKQGKIQESDLLGQTQAMIADGSIVEKGCVLLREVEIGGPHGVVVRNVEASIHMNEEAPVLLGNAVLDEVASVEVDNDNGVIRFKKK